MLPYQSTILQPYLLLPYLPPPSHRNPTVPVHVLLLLDRRIQLAQRELEAVVDRGRFGGAERDELESILVITDRLRIDQMVRSFWHISITRSMNQLHAANAEPSGMSCDETNCCWKTPQLDKYFCPINLVSTKFKYKMLNGMEKDDLINTSI